MADNDNPSPSAWYDRRDGSPAHDAMQLRVFRDLNRIKEAAEKSEEGAYQRQLCGERRDSQAGRDGWRRNYKQTPMRCVGVEAEYPLIARDRVIGFADIGRTWEDAEGYRYTDFIELKPKLFSVGAVIRQCHALDAAARATGRRCFEVIIVVYEDDEKLAMLRELSVFHIYALKGEGE